MAVPLTLVLITSLSIHPSASVVQIVVEFNRVDVSNKARGKSDKKLSKS